MKKSLIITLAAAAMMLVGVQASAQVSFGFGPATRLYFTKGQDARLTYGVQVNFEDSRRLSDVFGYSAGIDFGTYKNKEFFLPAEGTPDTGKGLSEMYVDIPVRAKFYIPFSYDCQFFIFAGVSPSVCIGSHLISGSDKTNRFGEHSTYSRYDVLAGGGIGLEIVEHLKLALGYDHGLLNRYTGDTADMHVAAAKFTVSYMF